MDTGDRETTATLRQKLIGTWECLSCTLTPIDSTRVDGIMHVLTENPNGNLIYSADGWMSALLQKPPSLLPKYTAGVRTISGTDEEILGVAKGTQYYAGGWGVEEGSARDVTGMLDDSDKEGGGDEGRGYLSILRKGPRTKDVRFRLYHDIKIGVPVNWIGEKQVRVGEMWEEKEEGDGGGEDGKGKEKRLFMSLGADFPVVVEGREWRVEAGWRKRV